MPGPLKETEGGRGAEETRGMKFLAEERDAQRKETQKRPLEKACRQQCCERDDVAQRRSGSIDEVAPKRRYDRRPKKRSLLNGTMMNNVFSWKLEDDAYCIPQSNCLEPFQEEQVYSFWRLLAPHSGVPGTLQWSRSA